MSLLFAVAENQLPPAAEQKYRNVNLNIDWLTLNRNVR